MKLCEVCQSEYDDGMTSCPKDGGLLYAVSPEYRLEGREIDGRFRIIELVGEGGMGRIFRALQLSTERDVALKILPWELSHRAIAVKRFHREAKLVSRMNHPNAVTVHDFGQSGDGLLYLVMEYVRGETLGDFLRRQDNPPLPVPDAVEIAVQVCNALEAAHDLGIVHRDLKPSNIMLTEKPGHRVFVKVLDFGLAKLISGEDGETQSGQICGTPTYMSPEQAQATAELTPCSDLYSLGVLLYELLCGRPPFVDRSTAALISRHVQSPPPALTQDAGPVPDALAQLVLQCLQKRPEDRPASASALRAALAPYLAPALPPLSLQLPPPPAEGSMPIARPSGRANGGRVDLAELTVSASDAADRSAERRETATRQQWAIPAIAAFIAVSALGALWILASSTRSIEGRPAGRAERQRLLAGAEKSRAPTRRPLTAEKARLAHRRQSDRPTATVNPTIVVTIATQPARAQLWIDGQYRGETPFAWTTTPRQQPSTVRLRKRGYRTRTLTLPLVGAGRHVYRLTQLPTTSIRPKKKRDTVEKSGPQRLTPSMFRSDQPVCAGKRTSDPCQRCVASVEG